MAIMIDGATISGGALITGTATDPYFSYVPLLLNTTSSNGQQNNTFLDSSTNNFNITRTGTPTQGSVTPYWPNGQWSNYFNGSTDYTSVGAASNWTFLHNGLQNYTIECWFFSSDNTYRSILGTYSTSPGIGMELYLNFPTAGAVGLTFNRGASGSQWLPSTSGGQYAINTWNHLSVTFISSTKTVNIYINGTLNTTASNTGFAFSSSNPSNTLFVGWTPNAPSSSRILGYISNLRIVNGVTVYTGNFTVTTTPLTATQSAGTNISAITGTATSLLTCQSNRFIDNSTNNFAVTVGGGTPTVQAFRPFSPTVAYTPALYGGSGYVNQSNAFLTFPLITLGSTFTVESWFYTTSIIASSNVIISNRVQDGGTKWLGFINSDRFAFSYGGTNREFLTTINTNTWYHFAFVVTSSTVTFYLNGTQIGLTQAAPTSFTLDTISGYGTGGMTGYLSNFRIVNGTAVYTGNFTPPTLAPLQTAGSTSAASYSSTTNVNTSFAASNTSLLLNFTNAAIYDAAAQNVVTTAGDAQASTTQSKWLPSSMRFDGTGDYLLLPDSVNLQLGSGDYTMEFWLYPVSLSGSFSGIIDTRTSGGVDTNGFVIYFGTSQLRFRTNGSDILTYSSFPTGAWTYVAITRSGSGSNNTKLFINGTQQAQATNTTSFTQTSRFSIGTTYPLSGDFYNGYIQDLRLTKGVARTVTTVPTAAFLTR